MGFKSLFYKDYKEFYKEKSRANALDFVYSLKELYFYVEFFFYIEKKGIMKYECCNKRKRLLERNHRRENENFSSILFV